MKSIRDLVRQPFLLLRICLDVVFSSVCWIIGTLATYIRIRIYAAKFPTERKTWPLLGDMHVAFYMSEPDSVRFFVDIMRKGRAGIIWFSIIPVFYVSIPQDVERVLSNSKSQIKPPIYCVMEPAMGQGLISSSGKHWQDHHKIIYPAFHSKILETFVPCLNRHADVLVDVLHGYADERSFNILAMSERFALDAICDTIMGINMKVQTNPEHEYLKNMNMVQECMYKRFLRPWFHNSWLYSMSSICRREKAALRVCHGFRDKVIQDRKERFLTEGDFTGAENGKKRRVAFLDHLLLSVKAGAQLTDQEIAEEVDTHMAAGADTASLLMAYTFLELARNQHVQEKVLKELERVYDAALPSITLNAEDLGRLTYLEMVLKETLRMHPPVPAVAKLAGEDIRLPSNNRVIPAGAQVGVSIVAAHKNPDIFPDPDRFDPERFSPEMSKDRHPFAFLPFSAGQRMCIGRRLAMMEIKVAVAKVLWKYKFFPEPGFEPTETWGITLKPVNGVRLRIQKRR